MVACIFLLSAVFIMRMRRNRVSCFDRPPSRLRRDAPVVQGWRNHGTERVFRDRKNLGENIGFCFDAMRVSLCKDT